MRLWSTSPKRSALVCIFSVLSYASPSSASPILDFTGSSGLGSASAGRHGTVGWSFTLLTPMTVDGLGVWDENGDGIYAPQGVGLWTSAGALLSSATVDGSSTPTASGSSAGQWLFTSVAPLVLDPGDYVLGALYTTSSAPSSDEIRASLGAPAIQLETLHPNINGGVEADVLIRAVQHLDGSYAETDPGIPGHQDPISSTTLTFTTIAGVTYIGSRAGAGETLTFPTDTIANGFGANLSVQAVPEPFTIALLGAGLAVVAARRYAVHARK